MVNVEQIAQVLKKHFQIGAYEIDPQTGEVSTSGNVSLKKRVSELPVKFGHVGGNFSCYNNQLTTLSGAPNHVGGNFSCEINQLTSLVGAPGHVGGVFRCFGNKLTSLEGAPAYVGGEFGCGINQLTTLAGAPKHVGRGFYCFSNQLTSLEGAPAYVGGDFDCHDNPLTSLAGAPDKVRRLFDITYRSDLALLRLLNYKSWRLKAAPGAVKQIMLKYRAQGKTAMLNCALELKKAGFADNARW